VSTQKQVAVIGGGVVGVSTAYFLAEAGHEVVVIERHHNVAQEASYASGGIIAPGHVSPWAAPGMPNRILSHLFRPEAPVFVKPTVDRALWRWARKWISECDESRYHINRERMQRVVRYSRDVLQQLREHYQLEYEQTQGVLQLLRTEEELAAAEPACALLAESGIAHQMLDPQAARGIEPALGLHQDLAGALYFPQDESGNCPLFTKRMRQVAQSLGVHFHFTSTVAAIEPQGARISLRIDDAAFAADAVVLAAGVDSVHLLQPLGINVPLYPVKGYSATAVIKDYDESPRASVIDDTFKVSVSRMGNRIRIAGTAELGSRTAEMSDAALRTLVKVGSDWFPNAANYNSAKFWCGAQPMLPDGPPILGMTPIRNLYVNMGHGAAGWAMAAGSGKVLADIISDRAPDIDLDGLTLSRYG
jgi:D-amino-acid dehydrogenase